MPIDMLSWEITAWCMEAGAYSFRALIQRQSEGQTRTWVMQGAEELEGAVFDDWETAWSVAMSWQSKYEHRFLNYLRVKLDYPRGFES